MLIRGGVIPLLLDIDRMLAKVEINQLPCQKAGARNGLFALNWSQCVGSQRNNAEQRIAAMRANGWKPETISAATKTTAPATDEGAEDTNLEDLAHDQIATAHFGTLQGP